MNKFILYILTEINYSKAVFYGDDLSDCLSYIKNNNLSPIRCIIISPNGRRITFMPDGTIAFGGMISQRESE